MLYAERHYAGTTSMGEKELGLRSPCAAIRVGEMVCSANQSSVSGPNVLRAELRAGVC